MRPYDIELPIFMGIFFALQNKINNDKQNKTSLQNQISNERSTFRSFLFGDSDSVKQMNTDVRAIQNKLNINQQNLKKIFSQLEADVPFFFINGKQGKFSDIFEKRDAND